jgi:hypothetical protein
LSNFFKFFQINIRYVNIVLFKFHELPDAAICEQIYNEIMLYTFRETHVAYTNIVSKSHMSLTEEQIDIFVQMRFC